MKNSKGPRVARGHVAAAALMTGLLSAAGMAEADEPKATPLPPIKVQGEEQGYQVRSSSTATKTDTPLRDTPQAVTVISRDAIDDLSMQSMADVVRYVPGVQMGQGEGHRDAPILRGNISTADFFVDGVRDDTQYYRDLYNAERIEVLKGPNAMIFGRGGGGGLINRVTKRADGQSRAAASFEAGSFDHYRGEVDAGTALTDRLAIRLNGMFEDSESYRDRFNLQRYGVNPTLTYQATDKTQIRLSYEYLDDDRTVDRGVPSQLGRPFRAAGDSRYFGNPDLSYATAQVHVTQAAIEHEFSEALKLSNKTVYASYDKFYQNVYPNSAVSAGGTFNLDAYHSGTQRHNLFNQTDLIWKASTGSVDHTILAGVEIGRQWTDNFRNNTLAGTLATVNPVSATNSVSFALPTSGRFFNSPNSNNSVETTVLGFYAQDQIKLLPWLELLAGLRYDMFDLDFDNHLNGQQLSRKDGLLSPRGGVIVKPIENVSLYGSYSVSYLPQSGDQFASLSATTAALRPEKFENIEVGVKWDITPGLSANLAAYQLDRDNTTATGPGNTTVLTGSQRSKGVELEIAGEILKGWQVLGGYAYQEAKITSTTSAAPAGRRVPLVPLHAASLWNKVEITSWLGVGVGVISQSEAYASISNAVKLPSFTRLDAALFFKINEHVQAQVNVENLLDRAYYSSAHNDNNVMPASPIAVRAAIKASLW